MTLDEAIEYYIKAATQRELADEEKGDYDKWNETRFMTKKQSIQIIADHRQLAEWLTELKELREENKVLISECDRLIKEKGELLKKSEQIAEYKRLLKVAVEDMKYCLYYYHSRCDVCALLGYTGECPVINDKECGEKCEWRYADEALALIGGAENE